MSNKIKILLALSLAVPLAFAGAETYPAPTSPTLYEKPAIKKIETKIESIRDNEIKIKENEEKRVENLKEKTNEKIDNIKEKIENSTEKADKKIEDLKNKQEDKKDKVASGAERKLNKQQDQIISLTQRTVDKLNAAIGRIEILSERTRERATIFVNDKKMTVEVKGKIDAKLAEATTLLEATKIEVGKIIESAKTALLTEKPKEAFKEVQASAKKIQEDLKDAHAKVVEAITMIKASVPKVKDEDKKATTTENQ